MTNVLMSDVFLLAPWLKDGGFSLEFGLPLSETVRALIARECYRGEEANYDFVGANNVETLQQANRLKEYILQYGINVDAIPLAAQEGDLLAGDLEEYKVCKEHLERLAMTLAQLEENAIARHPDTAPEVTRGHFRTMASDNYGAKRDEYSDLPLEKLKQLLHDLQLWELTRDAEAFKDLSPTSRESKKVVFAAVERNGEVLRYVCDDLRNDNDIVLAALRQNGQAIKYAGPSLRDDKELAFIALMNNPDCLSELPNDLRGGRDHIALLDYLKTEIVYALPERYRQGADEVLENDAYTSSEISFLIQDRSLSAVFKMEWTERIHTNDDIESYRDNLSKLLATKVILQLCKGDIHGARFAQMCTRRNIDSLSTCIRANLNGLNIEALIGICCRTEEVVDEYVASNALSLSSLGRAAYSSLSSFVGNMAERIVEKFTGTPAVVYRHTALSAVRNGGVGLLWVSYALRRDREVVLAALRQDGRDIRYADPSLKDDKELAFIALMNNPDCFSMIPASLREGRDRAALLTYLRTEIIAALPERYRQDAGELLENDAYISSEIPFVVQDRGLSDVLKMQWERRPRTHEDAEVYRDNLSKLLAIRVILGLCNGDMHSEWFAPLCTQQNITSLSNSIRPGLCGLDSDALVDVSILIERIAGKCEISKPSIISSSIQFIYSIPGFFADIFRRIMGVIGIHMDVPAASPPVMHFANSPLTQLVYSALRSSDMDIALPLTQQIRHTGADQNEPEDVAIPHIKFSRGFFESCIQGLRQPESQTLYA